MNQSKRGQTTEVRGTPSGKGGPFSALQIVVLVGLLLPLSLFYGAFLARQSHFSVPVYQTGDIARTDIIIPLDALIEDEMATEARRADAKARALPVYRFNPSLPDDQISRLKAAFFQSRALLKTAKGSGAQGRSFRNLPAAVKEQLQSTLQMLGIKPPVDDLLAFLVRDGFKSNLEDQIILLLQEAFSNRIVSDDTLFRRKQESVYQQNTVTGKVETVSVSLLSTLAQVRDQAALQIARNSRIAVNSRPHVRRILEGLIVPNVTLDEAMTRARQEQDVKNVDHVLRKLKKGKVVLRQGDEVGEDHLIQIEAIRKLSPTGSSVMQTAGMAFLMGILLTILVFVARFITLSQWSHLKLAGFLILTLTVNLLLLKASWFVCESVSSGFLSSPLNDKTYFFYSLPFAYGAMLVTLLAGERCALIFITFICILAGHAIGTDTPGLFYILITNLAGVIFIRKASQRIGIIGAGFKLGLSAALLFLILQAAGPLPPDWTGWGFGAALAFLSGFVNAVFLVFSLPLCERIFMVTTEMRLSELGNLNLRLVRELILKAPGTYNHSVAVGTLCEGAAKAIGLNPLFLRITSLYHDVGKTDQPDCFVENQHGINPHDQITPQESVRILKGHIAQGVSMAEKANLPSAIVDMIPQHHGTKLMRFFHEKAQKQAVESGEDIPEEPFRYEGPKPQTKAAAILMLADGIEAAARTLNDHSHTKLLDLIRKIITDTTEDGQLSECDITLSEMNRITYSFLETLSSYYHGRIAYPGFDFNQETPAKDNGLRPSA